MKLITLLLNIIPCFQLNSLAFRAPARGLNLWWLIVGFYIYICMYVCISYNTGTSALPDTYARSPRATGPRAEGIPIRQSTSAHVITNMLHF